MNGTLIKYIATPMLVTLIIRTEKGEEITVPLKDDAVMWLVGDHERVSYIPSGAPKDYVSPDKITCEIENDAVVRVIVETDGVETVEEGGDTD